MLSATDARVSNSKEETVGEISSWVLCLRDGHLGKRSLTRPHLERIKRRGEARRREEKR